ncbi:hypothetical protein MLD38_002187 [Melastoma candidum]|uniref:Uncharacterized protein n=1 Tax=Melastoma candidum TaxID=119954 RepID=A0ACB9SGX8_9MYRT|nr:hypothetical protein MLD38_002187 [Melastoma candidum]
MELLTRRLVPFPLDPSILTPTFPPADSVILGGIAGGVIMNGEIGVHNDAPLLNGKISEDFGMGGSVTIKEVMDLGLSAGSPVVGHGMENGSLSGKDRGVDWNTVSLAVKGGIEEVSADQKEILENGRVEGDDQIGNCVGDDEVVKRGENGAPGNGFCGANGHVLEIDVDFFKGKQGAVVETGSDVRENAVLENGDCGAGGIVEASKVDAAESNSCDVKFEDVKEAGIANHNDDIDCGAEDHPLSNGVATEELLSGLQDSKVEGVVVEHQNGRVDVMESVDRLIGVGSESDYVEELSQGIKVHPAADTEGTTEERFVDQFEQVMQEGISQRGGSIVVESTDAKIYSVEKSDDEIHEAERTDTASTVATEEIESARQSKPDHIEPVMQEGLSQTGGSIVVESADAKIYNVEKSDEEIHKAERTDTDLTVATEQTESAIQSQPDHTGQVIQEGINQTGGSIVVESADALIYNVENSDEEIHKAEQTDTGLTVATEPKESAIQSQPAHTEPVIQEGQSQTGGSIVVESADAKIYSVEKSDDEIHKAERTDTGLTVATEQIESAIQSQSDHTEPAMQEGPSQTGGSVVLESADDKIYIVEKSDDEIHKANQTDTGLTVAAEQIESAIQSQPDQTKPVMQKGLSQTVGSIVVESGDAKIYNVEKSEDEIHKAEQTDTGVAVATEQIESAIQSQPNRMSELDLCSSSDVEQHKVAEVDIEDPSADDKVEKVDEKIEEVEAGDVSVKEMSTMLEHLSTEGAGTAESDHPVEGHHNDAIPAVDKPECAVTVLEVMCTDENKDDGDIVPTECPVASDEKDPELDEGNTPGDSVESSSLDAKGEPLPLEGEKEEDIKNKFVDSDPSEVPTETRTAVDVSLSSLAGNASTETVICFGSFDQSELSCIPSEYLSGKKEDRHNVPGQDIDQSCRQAEVVDVTPQNDTVVAEVPVVASPKEQTRFSEVEKKVFNYLIKTPRFEDDLLKSKISDAQLQVDEKTMTRDAIKAEMHGKKSICKESSEKFGAAVLEEKAARELLKSKRQDVDLVQNEINKVKNAMSLSEIDAEICGMEHSIQHETLPLKEERELINKIRKLKQLRGQMSSSIGGEDELKAALNKREETEEHLKILKKDADSLRENCMKAEAVTKATKKIYYDGGGKLRELQTRFKEADEIRQDAYMQLQSLKKELYEKNKPFWKYRDDMKMATDLALKGDRESVSQLCIQQVETFMEAWNKNNEFREEYLKSNARRTLRRLGTADGRSLGPNEQAPSIPPIINERQALEKSFPPLPTPKLETVVKAVEVESSADKMLRKDADQQKHKPKAKNTIKAPPEIETVLAILERDEIPEKAKEPEVTEEEREQARKAKELRKKEEAEKLLEQRRLEEKVKEKEALERKRRNAERASARAAQKAQKEAEQKEKEREKRARKKERRRLASGNALSDDVPEGESQVPSEEVTVGAAPAEVEVRERAAPTRRPAHFTKQTKIAPIPAPLRNRGKRKMQPWMWVLVVALLVLLLFLAGNALNLF